MAAGSDSEKTQLSAIYGLEFYKSQKKWKLSENVRKEPPPSPKIANKLNRTFIKREEIPEPEFEGEPDSPDYEVILNKEPATTPSGVRPGQPYSGDGAEGLAQEGELPAPQPHHSLNWQDQCGAEAAGILDKLADDQCCTEAARLPEELAYDQCGTGASRFPGELNYDKSGTEAAGFLEELANDQYSPQPALFFEELAFDPEAALLPEELAYNRYIKEAAELAEDFAYDQSGTGAARFPDELALDSYSALLPEELGYNQCDTNVFWCGMGQKSAYLPVDDSFHPRDQSVFDFQNEVDPVDCTTPGEYLTPAQMQSIAEEWLLLHDYPPCQKELASSYDEHGGFLEFEALFNPRTSADLSCSIELPSQFMSELVDESADFMRGAHEALHSSEIDLSTTQEIPSKLPLWMLSLKQLERAVRRHQHALSLLLEERARRDRLKVKSPPSVPYPWLPFEQWIVPGVGRGRGRLLQMRK